MDVLRLALFGGVLGLDGTTVGQFMVSRPLVAGTLTGWLLGDPMTGAVIGTMLELYLLVSVPSGGARFPDAATATVVAVACAVPMEGMGSVPVAIAIGLVWGQVGGASIDAQRHVVRRMVPEPGAGPGVGRSVARVHTVAVLLDFGRAALVTGAGVVLGRLVLSAVARAWPLSDVHSVALLLVGGAVSAGILLNDLGGFRRRKVWLTAGIALGIVGSRFL